MARAVNEVIARTDAMRTIVLSNGMQAVLEKVPTYKIERFEFGNEKDREEKREQWSHCVFDLCNFEQVMLIFIGYVLTNLTLSVSHITAAYQK